MTREALETEILTWMRAGARAPDDPVRFDRLARALFRYQFLHNPAYRRICESTGRRSADLDAWTQIPPVPAGAFKEQGHTHGRLACFPEAATVRTFRTSGTTQTARGELHLDTLRLYEASLLQTFGAFVCPEHVPFGLGSEAPAAQRIPFHVLALHPDEAPDSSLSHMFAVAARAFGSPESRFWLRARFADPWDIDGCIATLEKCTQPIALMGTAFAFVHLMDRLESQHKRLELPPGSRILETGGFKGQSREVPRDVLHAELTDRVGVPPERIVNQYGMCELGSQFYEPSLHQARETAWKHVPPWVRTRALSAEDLSDVPAGEVGLLAHYDLANTGSVLAVLTADLGRVVGNRIYVEGRLGSAEARGCSRATDALLGRGGSRGSDELH